jgi:flagellar hook-associated protein 3 FlgL
MSVVPISLTRVSNLLQTTLAQQNIDSVQTQLLQVQNELSTGKQINQPSDNPAAASSIIQLNQTLAQRQTYSDNINSASAQLSETDSTLGNLTTILQQAESIASANVGSDASASQQQSASTVVQSIFNQALNIGNTQYNGMYLFGGADAQSAPFTSTNAGVQFVGSTQTLQNSADSGLLVPFQVNGANVFGSLATGVTGTADIAPDLTATTRLSDIAGTSDNGIRLGTIQISDGTVTKDVDLTGASNIGDVINDINNAGVGSITAAISGQGLTLSGTGAENISVTDVAGTAASDLGIATAPGGVGAGNPDVGASMNPRVTDLTTISDLDDGSGIDTSGFTISNGSTSKTFTWSAGATVGDLLNQINGSGLGIQAEINSNGTGLNILNATQGSTLSISENGGTTAAELGIRTFSPTTLLSALNNGQGITAAPSGSPDFQITAADGTTFQVSLAGATTIQDAINDINSASGNPGVTASFATIGNGIILTDNTTGSGSLSVNPLNNSNAAEVLGLTNPPSGNTVNGGDVNLVQSTGVFSDLQKLITGLQTGNSAMITQAGTGLTNDINNVIQVRGQAGAVSQQLTNQQTNITQENTATQSLISQLQDVNIADAVTQFQELQTALQASLQTTAMSLSLSLLDFLS